MKDKKGFTLLELLAVIAILALLVIITVPNIINLYNEARKKTFITEVKKLHSSAEEKFVSSSVTGKPSKIYNSEDDTKLNMTGEKLQYCILMDDRGNVRSLKASNKQ